MYSIEGRFFCRNCGEKVEKGTDKCPHCGAPYVGKKLYAGTSALGAGGVGWSDKANDPFFRAYAKKNVKVSLIWMIGLSVLIPALLLISGQVKEDGEGLTVMFVVPAIVWLFGLVFLLKRYGRGSDKSWDGILKDKRKEKKSRVQKIGSGRDRSSGRVEYMEYTLTFHKQDGREKKLIYIDNGAYYDYFNVGEHVRYHDTKYLKYLEKYDKSREKELFCAACGHRNDARDNYCGYCGAPMLKGNPNIASTYQSLPADEAPAYCKVCGAKLTGGAFCENCGAKVQE